MGAAKRATKRVQYDAAVMARLRFPMPDSLQPDSDADEAARDAVWDDREQYAREAVEEYDNLVTNAYLAAEALGEATGSAPSVLASELEKVSARLRALEEYRDRLIVFARTLASEPVPARTLAARTGLSHSTILRMATPEAIADIAVEAGPAAAAALEDVDPREDPQLFVRLHYTAKVAQEGSDDLDQ
jgi:hypothetical protein